MSAIDAFGTQLMRGDGADPEVFAAIADSTSITPPSMTRNTIDATSHDSVDGWMEFLGGLKDGGEVSMDINYQPAVHDILVGDFDDGEPRSYQLVFPDTAATTWTFSAVLTGFEADAPHDDKLAASLTWKVTGKPVLV